MARIIEITEKKKEKMASFLEDAFEALEALMYCFEEMDGEMGQRSGRSGMGNRGGSGMGNRDRYGNRNSGMGNREPYMDNNDTIGAGSRTDWMDDMGDEPMGERRHRSRRTGRFY